LTVAEGVGVAQFGPLESKVYEEVAVAARAQLGDGAFGESWERGAAMSLDEAVASALSIDSAA
jgi:hypothetical protein